MYERDKWKKRAYSIHSVNAKVVMRYSTKISHKTQKY